jgi:hypothetical protein
MIPLRLFLFRFSAIVALLILLSDANAQQRRQVDTEFVAPKKLKRTLPKKVEQEPLIKLDGSLTKAIKSRQPWQIINPLAPDSYGTGEQNVSQDPDELGRNEGLVLFGIQW